VAETIFSQVQEFGVSLHQAVLKQLIGQIEDAIADGSIRSQDGKHSVYDFLKMFFGNKNTTQTWKDLIEVDSGILRFTEVTKYTRVDGRDGFQETPSSGMAGLIYLAYMGRSRFSQELRRSSAALLAADYQAKFGAKPEPKEGDRPASHFQIPLNYLHEASGIVKKSQVREALLRNFNEFEHWVKDDDDQLWMTLAAFSILILSFRSASGAKVELCPEIIKVESVEYFRYQRMRQNCRTGKRDQSSPGQMGFEFD